MKIHFENVRSVLNGDLDIQEGKLNVFYGPNGIGKSSMVQSIKMALDGTLAGDNSFSPFLSDKTPSVTFSDGKPKEVIIYNQYYIDNCLFQGDDCLNNTFHLLFKTDELDRAADAVNKIIENVKALANGPEITKFIDQVQPLIEKSFQFAKPGKDGTTHFKAVGDAKFFQESIDKEIVLGEDLKQYDDFSKYWEWIDWVKTGASLLEKSKSQRCPLCSQEINEDIRLSLQK